MSKDDADVLPKTCKIVCFTMLYSEPAKHPKTAPSPGISTHGA